MKKYVYCFTRNDLSKSQIAIQSGHSIIELFKEKILEEHPSIILIGIKSKDRLLKEFNKLKESGFSPKLFKEPLINNEETSFSLLVEEDKRFLLKKYQLLK